MDPVSVDGVLPDTTVVLPLTVLPAITGLTVTVSAAEVSRQPPDNTNLLNQVVAVSVPEV